MTRSRTLATTLAVGVFGVASAAAAPDAVSAQDMRAPAINIEWWHPIAVGAGTGVLFLVDEPIADFLQGHQGSVGDDVASFANRFKDPEVYVAATTGALVLGLATGNRKVTVTGLHIAGAYGLAGVANIGVKWLVGRSRPSQTPDDPTNFDLFDGGENSAFPSGSAAVTYSLAAVLSDAIDRKPVTIALYSAAALNSFARMYTNRHWLSDMAFGAVVGITSAKLVNGEWTVFGLRPPEVWTDGRSLSMGYALSVR